MQPSKEKRVQATGVVIMADGRSRMYGDHSMGPRTSEGLDRIRQANLRHGHRSPEAISGRRLVRQLLREGRETIEWTREAPRR